MLQDALIWVLFAVNLTYIVTNVYGWLLKRFFVPDAYKEDVQELYPAQRSVAQFFFLQLFEIPYLFMVGQPEVLFYVNGTGLLVFSSFILVMVERYFFLLNICVKNKKKLYLCERFQHHVTRSIHIEPFVLSLLGY